MSVRGELITVFLHLHLASPLSLLNCDAGLVPFPYCYIAEIAPPTVITVIPSYSPLLLSSPASLLFSSMSDLRDFYPKPNVNLAAICYIYYQVYFLSLLYIR